MSFTSKLCLIVKFDISQNVMHDGVKFVCSIGGDGMMEFDTNGRQKAGIMGFIETVITAQSKMKMFKSESSL